MRFLIVCAFFCHYNSVFAFLDYEDVGVVVLSHYPIYGFSFRRENGCELLGLTLGKYPPWSNAFFNTSLNI